MDKVRKRGFEIVIDKHRVHKDVEIQLPRRATNRSSGYDIFSPIEVSILPNESIVIPSDIKAYMLDDEELLIFPRSSLGLKKGLVIKNTIGKIDSDYYSCEENDGNIKISIWNTSNSVQTIKKGDRICQCSFYNYLITDDDNPISDTRSGGVGSSGS